MDAVTLRIILLAIGVVLLLGLYWWEYARAPNYDDDDADRAAADTDDDDAADQRRASFKSPTNRFDEDDREPSLGKREPILGKREPSLGIFDDDEPVEPPAPRWGGGLSSKLRRTRPAPVENQTAAASSPSSQAPAAELTAPAATASPADQTAATELLVQLFVVVPEDTITGADVMTAANKHHLQPGEHAIFHHYTLVKPPKGVTTPPVKKTLFSMANLVNPGSFPFGTGMRDFRTRGLALFTQLDGDADDLRTLDTMFSTAAALAEQFNGLVQDRTRSPLTPLQISKLRDQVKALQKNQRPRAKP
ncbi:hypothetical protein HUU62_05330 [Rhodoferax sp. 4810]|uniref:Cell division protein ZipA n=1 Tax=Thiospirillum jenense TaxID=1653858 RepID=A0A839H5K2_9GAMM|nr:cell division protein ZipA C-terminal FtsZ-binding domain-containing protein [Thiospirillum jenense]MBB1073832.1 hypothetical protein [Rhodoferax jenense]MBB1125213.1 hypothetical protein [Thiospirillum jenense]